MPRQPKAATVGPLEDLVGQTGPAPDLDVEGIQAGLGGQLLGGQAIGMAGQCLDEAVGETDLDRSRAGVTGDLGQHLRRLILDRRLLGLDSCGHRLDAHRGSLLQRPWPRPACRQGRVNRRVSGRRCARGGADRVQPAAARSTARAGLSILAASERAASSAATSPSVARCSMARARSSRIPARPAMASSSPIHRGAAGAPLATATEHSASSA